MIFCNFIFSENILFGQTEGKYGSILTDGQRETSCIVENGTTTVLNIAFDLEKNYSINSVSIFFKGNISFLFIFNSKMRLNKIYSLNAQFQLFILMYITSGFKGIYVTNFYLYLFLSSGSI